MTSGSPLRSMAGAAALALVAAVGAPDAGARTAKPVPHFTSYQLRDSFGAHETQPGHLTLKSMSPWVREELERMGYTLDFEARTSGPINAAYFDTAHGSFWGGSSNHGDDYGIAW